MHDDDPGDVVHDTFAAAVFGDSPLGRPILGTVDSITGMSRATVAHYYRRRYSPSELVVTAAGNVDHKAVVALVRKAFKPHLVDGAEPGRPRVGGRKPRPQRGIQVVKRATEQAHLVLGATGIARADDRRFALGVLNGALGGGMSSRLFQEIREKRGLAYSVYSYSSQYADTGLVGVYAGCAPQRAHEVLELAQDQLTAVVRDGLTEEELVRGKGQLRGSIVLGLEDTSSRMSRLGKAELVYGELMTVDGVLAHIEAVTLDDVRAVAHDLLRAPDSLAVIGPFAESDFAGAVA
jgi:predicted Zn-dependent peptidase